MKNTAVCYVTDIGYLLPSIVSARSLRKFASCSDVGVFIFTADVSETLIEKLNSALENYNIEIIGIDSSLYANVDVSKYRKNHVPLAAVGRFFITEILPREYSHIVYVDGDTWFASDPIELFIKPVPEGYIAAADDSLQLQQHNNYGDFGKRTRDYFSSLGVNSKMGYFNSGVFSVARQTWEAMSKDAYNYLLDNTEICLHHDQSALNAVATEKRLKLSCAWNFQTPYKYLNVEEKVEPKIYHFTKQFKPWMGEVIPWDNLHKEYMIIANTYHKYDLPLKSLDQGAIDRYNKKASLKKLLGKTIIIPIFLKLMMGYYVSEKQTWL